MTLLRREKQDPEKGQEHHGAVVTHVREMDKMNVNSRRSERTPAIDDEDRYELLVLVVV